MPNNVTELTQRLLRSLDSNYNVVDMPEVVNIITLLEKVAITKELLQATRLGKYVNEVRRKTTNEELGRRTKELVKKWRTMLIPEANGQMRAATQPASLRTAPNMASPPLEGQNLKAKVGSIPQKKVSPPVQKMPTPGMQARMVSPIVQKLGSPAIQSNQLVSPQLRNKLVSPHTEMVSPGIQVEKLANPPVQMLSPTLEAHQLVTPHKMLSPGGQRVSPKLATQAQRQKIETVSPPLTAGHNREINQGHLKSKKRYANEVLDNINAKRSRLNGAVTDLEVSDSSNSSFKDVISKSMVKPELKRDVIVNSDSNSSFPERTGEPHIDQQLPKKRGRKKGSKNHKNLLDEAETSFTNKLAVSASRGGSKVKTTQEILAGIQNKNTTSLSLSSVLKPSKEDLEEKAAKLTERVSIIDRKLNANAHRNKNSHKSKLTLSASKPNERVIESGSVINDKSLLSALEQEEDEDEVVVVDDADSAGSRTEESQETDAAGPSQDQEFVGARSLSIEDALAQLPPIDRSVLEEQDPAPYCTCRLKENKPKDFSIGDEDDDENEQLPPFEIIEDPACPAKTYLAIKYHVDDISDNKIQRLHESFLPNVNGNWSLGTPRPESLKVNDLYVNIVPHIYERLDKDVRPFDSFKKYSVSEGGSTVSVSNSVTRTDSENTSDINGSGANPSDSVIKSEPQDPYQIADNSEKSDIRTEEKEVFREWYECVDSRSYNEETLRILPYCILD